MVEDPVSTSRKLHESLPKLPGAKREHSEPLAYLKLLFAQSMVLASREGGFHITSS